MPRVKRRQLVGVLEVQLDEFPRGLEFSPDARALAVGAADGTVTCLDATSGARRWQARLPGSVSTLGWSPDGARLAAGCLDGTTRLFDAAGRELRVLPAGRAAWVEQLAWSPAGVLASASGRVVRLWTSEGEPVLETQPHESTVTGLGWSPDGRTLYSACYGGVRAWPLEANVEARHLAWKGSLVSLAISPDGAVVAGGGQDCTVHFWRLPSGEDAEMSGYAVKPRALAWSPDSKRLATGGAAHICVWRFEGEGPEGTKPQVLKGHEKVVTQLRFAEGSRLLASGSEDGDVLLWTPDEGVEPAGLAPVGAPVAELAFSRGDALLAAGGANGRVVAWRPMGGTS